MAKILISLPTGDVTHELKGDVITVGRTPDNKIQINHHSVSAHHARLILSNGNYRLKDLESTNRTCVNDIPITEAELTGSCFLRFGKIECVYKSESPTTNEQLFTQLNEAQSQVESLMKARDLIHQQNQALIKERDEAKLAAESTQESLAETKKQVEQITGQLTGVKKQFEEASSKLVAAQKQIDLVSRERDSLFESSNQLQARLNEEASSQRASSQEQINLISRERDSLLESNKELQARLETTMAQLNEARQRQAEAPAFQVQPKAVEPPSENGFDEPHLAEEEEELAGVGQAAAAGNSAGRAAIAAPPLVRSWLQRATKRKNSDEQSAVPTNITPMTLPAEDKNGVVVAPIPAPPALKLVPPPNGGVGKSTSRLRGSTNSVPQNPEIRPAWELLNTMRRTLHYFLRHQDELKVLQEMGQSAHSLTESSQSGLLRPIQELAFALEALIRDLYEQPKNIGPSALRTIGQSIDFLATLLDETNLSKIRPVSTAKIFAVDDDTGILDTITSTMAMVQLKVISAAQSLPALTMLTEQNCDLILLDVGLPQMNGMDLCSRVRTLPQHQKTPIVFLTGEATAQNRVQSTLNGGNDMIGKPFSILELAVKSLTWIFKGQLGLV